MLWRKHPVVTCPGCNKPMAASEPRRLMFTDVWEIAYTCMSCGTKTKRTMKLDEEK
jgi:RNase P subunit RPR2